MKSETLHDLIVEELKILYYAERQIFKAWPRIMKGASRQDLQIAFQQQLHQTQDHVAKLEPIFDKLRIPLKGKRCPALARFLEKGREVLKEKTRAYVRDASLIAVAQKIEHYKMAGYGSLQVHSRLVGDEESAALLQQNLEEEEGLGRKLTRLAGTISA